MNEGLLSLSEVCWSLDGISAYDEADAANEESGLRQYIPMCHFLYIDVATEL